MSISQTDQEIVDKAREALLEHFDSVQVFVTRHAGERDVTASYETGGGNFYARLGQVHEWIMIQDQYSRQHAKRKDEEAQQ